MTRTWGGGPAGMDSATVDDLTVWLVGTLVGAISLATGIQEQLMP